MAANDVFLRPDAGDVANDVRLRTDEADSVFPTQYFGLKAYYQGAVQNLCLVAEADAPSSMGGVMKVNKNGTKYVVYLVETTDPNASPCYIRTSTGTKAIREKT